MDMIMTETKIQESRSKKLESGQEEDEHGRKMTQEQEKMARIA